MISFLCENGPKYEKLGEAKHSMYETGKNALLVTWQNAVYIVSRQNAVINKILHFAKELGMAFATFSTAESSN